jgi:FKBP-type peptidyl-prolyl cis-trans isomerase
LFLLLASLAGGVFAAGGFTATGTGLEYRDLKPGSGEYAAVGDVATIHFTGWLDDRGQQGREIYNTRGRRPPVSFVIGTERVMPAWNEGVIGMQAGGRRLVKVPGHLGYGAKGVPGEVPSNARLIFMIELLQLDKRVKR